MDDDAPRFRVDGMVVRLGKYLRCLGYDAAWDVSEPSRVAARRADHEGRVFLTRNTRLGEDVRPPTRFLVLTGEDPVEHWRQVARALALAPGPRLFTRCIRCNLALQDASEAQVAAHVPEVVRRRHRRFFACAGCGTIFWRGSHVANTCRKLGLEPPPG